MGEAVVFHNTKGSLPGSEMHYIGNVLLCFGVLLAFIALFLPVTVQADLTAAGPGVDVVNLRKLSDREFVFQAGLAAAMIGAVLSGAGLIARTVARAALQGELRGRVEGDAVNEGSK